MNETDIRKLLTQIQTGEISMDSAVDILKTLPFQDLGFAKVDTHRALRTGFPEVIYCEGKRAEQVVEIFKHLMLDSEVVLATRASQEIFMAVAKAIPKVKYHEIARMITYKSAELPKRPGVVLVVSAGTADQNVAQEAVITAKMMGNHVEQINDVGVAGIHRLLAYTEQLSKANVIIVVAGMEGALPSVVAGLVSCPVIAVPTSVGYGANFGGLAALLGMLNSCASGLVVVNIDNGFGAGYAASMINRLASP